jgi:capsid protein
MDIALDALPSDPHSLRAIIATQAAELAARQVQLDTRDSLIARLKAQLAVRGVVGEDRTNHRPARTGARGHRGD